MGEKGRSVRGSIHQPRAGGDAKGEEIHRDSQGASFLASAGTGVESRMGASTDAEKPPRFPSPLVTTVEDWRCLSVGSAYPLLPRFLWGWIELGRANGKMEGSHSRPFGYEMVHISTSITFSRPPYNAGRRDFPRPV